MTRGEKHLRERCIVPECTQSVYCRGRCSRHYASFLAEQKVFKAMQRIETPQREPYTWVGDEEALAAQYGENDKCLSS